MGNRINHILAVHDVSILIDLIEIDIYHLVAELNLELRTTDFILAELSPVQQAFLLGHQRAGTLIIDRFSFEETIAISELNASYNPLSLADCSVLFRASQLNALLLTGDKPLRKIAEERKLSVHGILWLLDQLVEQGVSGTSDTYSYLEKLMRRNKRLPLSECVHRLKLWKP